MRTRCDIVTIPGEAETQSRAPLTSAVATLGAALSSWGEQAPGRRAAQGGAGPGAAGHAPPGADAQAAGRGAPLAVVLREAHKEDEDEDEEEDKLVELTVTEENIREGGGVTQKLPNYKVVVLSSSLPLRDL